MRSWIAALAAAGALAFGVACDTYDNDPEGVPVGGVAPEQVETGNLNPPQPGQREVTGGRIGPEGEILQNPGVGGAAHVGHEDLRGPGDPGSGNLPLENDAIE